MEVVVEVVVMEVVVVVVVCVCNESFNGIPWLLAL